jgi:cytochrome P450
MISHASWLATGLALLALLSVSTVKFLLSTTRPRNFPPGPPTRLGLGNAHQIPKKQPFLQFLAWSKTYGDVLGLKAGPENIVVLSSPEAVHELFSLRGAVYSGRPDRVIPANYVYRGHIGAHVLSMQNNASLRRFRATISSATSGTGSMSAVLSVQNAKAAALVHDILMKPSDFPMHIACWVIDLALRVVTGQRLEDRGMAFVQRIIGKSSKWTPLMNPGMIHPVERMPLLRLVPEVLSTWKQNARTARQYMTEEYAGFFQTAKELSISRIKEAKREIGDVAKNNKKGFCNIMTTMIEENSQKEASKRWTDEEMAWSGGSTFDAAIGTSQAAIMIFILHVAAHPDVQAKIHEELDRVCGDRPPGVETFQKLPYLRASVLEVSHAPRTCVF